jgi:1,4-alpha-glucan branching enzyme
VAKGCFLLLLHAHLPWVYEPAYERFLEEYWFFEAMNETYLPLLVMLRRLRDKGIRYRVAVSFSPTLIAMMEHGDLLGRFRSFLDSLQDLAKDECAHWANDPMRSKITQHYKWLFAERRAAFDSCGGYILNGFAELANQGHVELLTAAATHPFLPNLQGFPLLTSELVCKGLDVMHYRTGARPAGIWLPESGYYPGLENTLANCGVHYFQVETHGLLHASPKPAYGILSPVFTEAGVAAFGRHPQTGRAVWSADQGYPGDPAYREFYRDVGWDAETDHVRRVLPPDGARISTGLKYYAITDRKRPLDQRALYDPDRAMARVRVHAKHFVSLLEREARKSAPKMKVAPAFFSPYDAELYGHWWFEGIAFLEEVFSLLAKSSLVEAETPSGYLVRNPVQQVATPNMSSWGDRGFSQVWVNQFTEWAYPHQLAAAERYERMLRERWHLSDEAWRWLRTEMFLAVSSDFPFMISTGTYGEYAARRLREHLHLFHHLASCVERGEDIGWFEPFWRKRPQVF